MENRDYIALAMHFYLEYVGEDNKTDKELDELFELCRKIVKKEFSSEKEVVKSLDTSYRLFAKMTEGEDVYANAIIMMLGCLFLCLENEYFKGSNKMAMNRLTLSIYRLIEKYNKNSKSFKNANRLISKLGEQKWK